MAGALIGHLLPIARGRPIPAATESAPLNIAGGALLLALGQVLDGLVDDGFIGKGDVEEIAGMILAGTANRLYKIG
jgi:hypothetical protein